MLWNYPKKSITNKRVAIKYREINKGDARDSVFNQLGYPVYIEGANSQKAGFQLFLRE